MFEPLIWVRALHFAATVAVSGAVLFLTLFYAPALRGAGEQAGGAVGGRIKGIIWIGVLVFLISALGWLVLQTAQMSGLPAGDVFSQDAIGIVLARTGFGQIWLVRLILVGVLVLALSAGTGTGRSRRSLTDAFLSLLAAAIAGTPAWAGHAAAGSGTAGTVHLISDILHLVAAAAWLGALLPLALTLGAAWRARTEASLALARMVTLRFSAVGIAGVAVLLATGAVNTWMLVGSVEALVGTDYGRLLMTKVALFIAMLTIAAVNRQRLTPRLVAADDVATAKDTLHRLRRNSLVEAMLGAVILAIVGALGILPPGPHAP